MTQATHHCASTTGFDSQVLLDCYNGAEGDAALVREAKATIDHPGTPYIAVNGVAVDDPDNVMAAVCEAYTGTKPSACSAIHRHDCVETALK